MRDFKPTAWLVLLFAADTLFLWMFFASAGFERMFEANSAAHDFAARWRHGMNGGCPLYMPGYFAVSLAMWFWSRGRNLQRLCFEGAAVLLTAALASQLLAPLGTAALIEAFQQAHLSEKGLLQKPPLLGTVRGLFTLAAWSALVVACRRSLVKGSFLPLALPLVLGVVLAWLRPVATFNAMISLWWERILEGDGAAIVSFLAIPGAATLLVCEALNEKRSKRAPKEKFP